MDIERGVDLLWDSMERGAPPPADLHRALSLPEAYRIQLGILDRLVASGEKLGGWKLGCTSEASRKMIGVSEPVSGFLLERNHSRGDPTIDAAAVGKGVLETELGLTLGKPLKGPDVTRAQVVEAVSSISPAFEIVQARIDIPSDLPLGVADNLTAWGFVTGNPLASTPRDLNLGDVRIEMRKNGSVAQQAGARDNIEDPFESVAWLANHLAEHDRRLEAGQCIITGSCLKPVPVAQGDRYEATFSSVGTVAVVFR